MDETSNGGTETIGEVLQRIGRRFSVLVDEDRSAAYKYLRREFASNLALLARSDEIGNIKEWLAALAKVEEGMGGNQADDLDYPLDKIAAMLNETTNEKEQKP